MVLASDRIADYRQHPVSEAVAPGDLLVADWAHRGSLKRGDRASDPAVVGIVSQQPGVLMGAGLAHVAQADPELRARLDEARARGDRKEEAAAWAELQKKFESGHAAVALSGTVPCKVDATYGAIQVGDLLAASPTPGRAMRSPDNAPGTIVGKALEPLENGVGVINVLVMLR